MEAVKITAAVYNPEMFENGLYTVAAYATVAIRLPEVVLHDICKDVIGESRYIDTFTHTLTDRGCM